MLLLFFIQNQNNVHVFINCHNIIRREKRVRQQEQSPKDACATTLKHTRIDNGRGSSSGSVDSACGSWSMGLGFEFHQGHWSYQEGHPKTIAPVLQRQMIPKTRREKSPIQGMGMGMETLNGHEFLYTYQQTCCQSWQCVTYILTWRIREWFIPSRSGYASWCGRFDSHILKTQNKIVMTDPPLCSTRIFQCMTIILSKE